MQADVFTHFMSKTVIWSSRLDAKHYVNKVKISVNFNLAIGQPVYSPQFLEN